MPSQSEKHPISVQMPFYRPKQCENPTLWATHTYVAHTREHPLAPIWTPYGLKKKWTLLICLSREVPLFQLPAGVAPHFEARKIDLKNITPRPALQLAVPRTQACLQFLLLFSTGTRIFYLPLSCFLPSFTRCTSRPLSISTKNHTKNKNKNTKKQKTKKGNILNVLNRKRKRCRNC